MKKTQRKVKGVQFIRNDNGNVEFVVIPVKNNEDMIEALEDFGLGLAMKEAEGAKLFNKKDAIKYLKDA